MMNLSTMFSNYVKLYILIVGIGLAAFMGYEKLFILAGVTIVLTFVGLLIPQNEKGDSGLLQKIETVVQRSSQGDLEQRITKIDPNSPYVLLAWSINNLLDQTEAFIRDAVTTIEKIELDEQPVTVYTDGFKGSFQSSMFPIQKALAQISQSNMLKRKGELANGIHSITGGAGAGLMTIKNDVLRGNDVIKAIFNSSVETAETSQASILDIDHLSQRYCRSNQFTRAQRSD
jgi:hypothetical protein